MEFRTPWVMDNKEKICSLRLDEQTLKRLNVYCERLKVASEDPRQSSIWRKISIIFSVFSKMIRSL